jgi:hypothetical protein
MFFSFSNVAEIVVPLTILVVYLALVLLARPDRDEEGNGLYASYLGLVGVTSMYALLTFGVAALAALGELILVDRSGIRDEFGSGFTTPGGALGILSGYSSLNTDSEVQAALVLGLALTAAAAIVFVYHLRRREELAITDGYDGSAPDRIDRVYRATLAFVAVTVGIIAVGWVGDAVYRLLAEPDTTGVTREVVRDRATVQLVAYGALVAATIALFRSSFWAIRGDTHGEADEDLVEMGD